VAETPVEIWQGTKSVATVTTDADVRCMWAYKCTGKAATLTVRLTVDAG